MTNAVRWIVSPTMVMRVPRTGTQRGFGRADGLDGVCGVV